MTGVERRLAAADLRSGEVDLEAGLAQEQPGVGGSLREEQVSEARGKELDALHRPDSTAAPGLGALCEDVFARRRAGL
jgi:hypothetical protein